MKKQLAAAFAAMAIAGVTTAFAANPFSDVTPNDWAYQAVSNLAQAGIVNGFPNGTFQGQKDMTRFEMAQIVAKAMAYQGKITAEQQATINKLAAQFGDELKTLGVKVDALNNKIGNVKVTGDARVRYEGKEKTDSQFNYRARLNMEATVNDSTKAQVRFTTGDGTAFGDTEAITVNVDRLNVAHQFGDAAVVLGRQDLFIGNGLSYDGAFDGAAVAADFGGINVVAGHGYLLEGVTSDEHPALVGGAHGTNKEVTLVQAKAPVGVATVGGFYAKMNAKDGFLGVKDMYGANLSVGLGGNTTLAGEYLKSNAKKSDAWTASLTNGNYDQAKAGTYDVVLAYTHENTAAPVVNPTGNQPANTNYKGWNVQADYALANNVGLTAWYNFSGKTVDGTKAEGSKTSSYLNNWEVSLNYQF